MGKNAQRRRGSKGVKIVRGSKNSRVVQLDDEMAAMIERQKACFREKFGREIGPTDPIFFDSSADVPRMIDREVLDEKFLKVLRAANLPPALVHAAMRTGMFVTDGNLHLWSEEDLDEWQAAVDEYHELQKRGGSN